MPDTDTTGLPYSDPDNPATVNDVASELSKLVRLNAATVATLSMYNRNPTALAQAVAGLDDAKTEPGQSLFVQETRFALALLSFVSDVAGESSKDAIEALQPYLHTHIGPIGSTS